MYVQYLKKTNKKQTNLLNQRDIHYTPLRQSKSYYKYPQSNLANWQNSWISKTVYKFFVHKKFVFFGKTFTLQSFRKNNQSHYT